MVFLLLPRNSPVSTSSMLTGPPSKSSRDNVPESFGLPLDPTVAGAAGTGAAAGLGSASMLQVQQLLRLKGCEALKN